MADYFTLLSRAVASLGQNTKVARDALYNRARDVLVNQLRAADPPWTDAQIEAEAASLESAIRQVEFEVWRSSGRPRGTPNEASPPQRQIEAAEDADAETDPAPQRTQRSFSTALIGAIGAVVLAIVAAGGYAYLSRPGAKPQVTAAPAATSADSKPNVRQKAAARKTIGAASGKSAETTNSPLPYVLRRQLVYYRSTYPAGTIIVIKSQHMLYQVRAETVALRYSIGIGPKCSDAAGLHRIVRKEMSPAWPPASAGSQPPATPASAGERRIDSPLGAAILYLNDIEYGIHGTDRPNAIGQNSAFGCFLLVDDDISDLYGRVPVDTRVVITN